MKATDSSARKDLTLTQLRYFIAAAQHRSMTEAAAELYVAQSAVSTAIAQLERTLDVDLFIRQPTKGLALTPSGTQLLRDARSLLGHLDELTENARAHGQVIEGVLRLACFVTLAPFILPKLISAIAEQHPDLRIEVFEADFDEITKMLRNGMVEAALTYDYGPTKGISYNLLYTSEPHVILPADHALAQQDRISLAELHGWDLILLDIPHSREYFLNMLPTGIDQLQVRHSSRSYETVRSLVARGHGFSILNNIPASDLTYDGGHLKAVPIADPVQHLKVCFAHATDIRPSARSRAVAAIAESMLQNDKITQ